MSETETIENPPVEGEAPSPAPSEEKPKRKKAADKGETPPAGQAGPLPVIEVHVKALRAAMKAFDKVVEGRNTIPILSNVLIEAADGRMSITGTDLDVQLVVHMDCTVQKRVRTTLAAKLLRDILAKLDADATLVLTIDAGKVIASVGRSKFTLPTLPADDFPLLTVGDTPHQFEVAAFDLAAMFDATSVAMSKDETRYYLNGVFLHAAVRAAAENPGEEPLMVLRAAATDGHRLARFDVNQPDGSGALEGIIVPRKTISVLAVVLDEFEGEVGVSASASKIEFDLGDRVLTSKLVDGTFPEYARVIPTANDKQLRCDRAMLASAVDRVMVLSEAKTRAVKVELNRDILRVSVSAPERGEAVEEVPCDYDATPLTIGFNGEYLLGLLGHVQGGDVEIMLADPKAPALITDENPEARRLYVLMPMAV